MLKEKEKKYEGQQILASFHNPMPVADQGSRLAHLQNVSSNIRRMISDEESDEDDGVMEN